MQHADQAWRTPETAVWSGDTVVADDEGFLYFVGRRDDMIKTSGYRVSPTEIEEAAYSTGLVRDVVAVGVDDLALGQRDRARRDPGRRCARPGGADRGDAPDTAAVHGPRERSRARRAAALAQRKVRPKHDQSARSLHEPARARFCPFGTIDGELRVGGLPLSRLAERVGSTPFFAYDRGLLDSRVDRLRAALPSRVELSYAMKANPMPAVIQHLARRVDRIDVASGLEMQAALDTTMSPDRVSFAGPGKSPAEIRQAVAAGIIVEVESPTEFRRVAAAGEALGVRPSVAVRVNPDFAVKGSGMRMGGGPQQFGIDAEQVPAVLEAFAAADVDVLGFHIFAGSQNLNAEIIAEAQMPHRRPGHRSGTPSAHSAALSEPRRRLRHPLHGPRSAARPRRGRRATGRAG